MKRYYAISLLIFAFWGCLTAQPSRYVEAGKIIVKLRPDAVGSFEGKSTRSNHDGENTDTAVLTTGIRSFDGINRRYGAKNMRRIFPDAGEYEEKHRKYGLHLWYEIIIPEDENPETVAAEYNKDENVLISEPRYKIRRHSIAAPYPPTDEMPNDPDFSKQWNFNNTGQTGGTPGVDVKLLEAYEKVRNKKIKNNNVTVAVMDGGVYHDHEDLKENMWTNDNGLHGYNFVRNSNTIIPEDHATHVAGIIAAVTNNSTGVAGMAGNPEDGYGIRIMTVQILEGDRSVSNIGPAFTYAADKIGRAHV